jgi:D-glycero-D-manno-heptose 1,7-bisphosphate phosphatase
LTDYKKIIILDRDGVINADSDDFIKSPEEWRALPGSLEAIGELSKSGYQIYILTNQSGIARGYFSEHTLSQIHKKLHTEAAIHGGKIEGIYYCPHGPQDSCDCRKPLSGLYQQLANNSDITSFTNIASVGDSIRDLQAAQAAGAKPILVKTGKGLKSMQSLKEDDTHGLQNVECYESLTDYVSTLLNHEVKTQG